MANYIQINDVKEYLRIDNDEENGLLNILIKNAETYIENGANAIDTDNPKMVAQAQLIGLVLISDYYENRELFSRGKSSEPSEKVRYIVQSMLNQLRYCYGGDIT